MCTKRGPFWDPFFFTCGPLGPKKGARGFNTGTFWLPGEAPEAQKTPEAHVDSIQGIILFSALTAKRRRPRTPPRSARGGL